MSHLFQIIGAFVAGGTLGGLAVAFVAGGAINRHHEDASILAMHLSNMIDPERPAGEPTLAHGVLLIGLALGSWGFLLGVIQ